MIERSVNFKESNEHDNPVVFELMPLPDQEYLDAFYKVIEGNPRSSTFGTVEVKPSGETFRALVWDREHILADDEDGAMKVANNVYGFGEYQKHHFRNILKGNHIENPFLFRQELAGRPVKIPAIMPAEIIQGYVKDWVAKTNASLKAISKSAG